MSDDVRNDVGREIGRTNPVPGWWFRIPYPECNASVLHAIQPHLRRRLKETSVPYVWGWRSDD